MVLQFCTSCIVKSWLQYLKLLRRKMVDVNDIIHLPLKCYSSIQMFFFIVSKL